MPMLSAGRGNLRPPPTPQDRSMSNLRWWAEVLVAHWPRETLRQVRQGFSLAEMQGEDRMLHELVPGV